MAMPNAQQVATNWANGMANSSEKLKAGINNVTVAPTEKAAMAVDRQVVGVQRAANSGKTATNLRKVSLQDWKDAALNKGVGRVAAGAQNAKPKMAAFMTKFLPYLQQGVDKLANMPRGDLEQNIARATTMMRHNAEFQNS